MSPTQLCNITAVYAAKCFLKTVCTITEVDRCIIQGYMCHLVCMPKGKKQAGRSVVSTSKLIAVMFGVVGLYLGLRV